MNNSLIFAVSVAIACICYFNFSAKAGGPVFDDETPVPPSPEVPKPPPPLPKKECKLCKDDEERKPKPNYKPSANGCGPEDGPKIHDPVLEPCCNAHDICFDSCTETKDSCGESMKTCMENICNARTDKDDCLKRAGIYLHLVTKTDKSCESYLKAQNKACDCVKKVKQNQ